MALPKVAAVSIGPADEDPLPLWMEAEAGIKAAAQAGATLVVLPELFAQAYVAGEDPGRWSHRAETIEGRTATRMATAARSNGVAVLFGMALTGPNGLPLNAAALARADGSVERVAGKIHLPPANPADAFGEADHFAPGPAIIGAVEVGPIRVATLICYDRRFPECWRAAAKAGADLIAVMVGGPAPSDPEGLFASELRTHARANAVYALTAARYGTETVLGHPVRHDGESLAIDPNGAILAIAPQAAPRLVVATVDFARLAEARAQNATARCLRLSA
ncbi:carbon-nitrogen hydrolase family protein [Ancylobacter aquaticus]|nr:carbon-nitrogen hydrolase family protein [Ancylobacter aquaticus]